MRKYLHEDNSTLLQIARRVERLQFECDMHSNRETILAREQERLDQLVAAGRLSHASASTLMSELEASLSVPPSEVPSDDMLAAAEFVESLIHRQASRPPDFTALYQRQQELDAARDDDVRSAD